MSRQKLPSLTTIPQYREEARQAKHLVKVMGGPHSGFANRAVVEERWRRNAEFFGLSTRIYTVVPFVSMLAVGLVIGVIVTFRSMTILSVAATEYMPFVYGAVTGSAGSLSGFLVAWILLTFWKWKAAYCAVWVFESADREEPWRTTSVLKVYMPRLAFVNEEGLDYFTGPTRESGARDGVVHLKMPEQRRITSLRHMDELFDLEAARSEFTEVPARECYQLLERAVRIGILRRDLGVSKWQQFLSENWPWILTGIFMFIAFAVASQGSA